MSVFALVMMAGLVVLAIYAIMIYNSLVQVKHNVSKAWANIDVLLKQRHDEMPKLVETCKQYTQFEQDTLQRVIEARSRVFQASQAQNMPAPRAGRERAARGARQPVRVAEAYPELKTNEQFHATADAHQRAGERHRRPPRVLQRVASTSTTCASSSFPTSSSRACSTSRRQLLEFQEEEKRDVDVKRLFAA